MASVKSKTWAVCFGWLAAVYLFIPMGRAASSFLRVRGMLWATILGVTVAAIVVFSFLWKREEPGYRRLQFAVVAVLGALSLGAIRWLQTPEEWIHLPQYLVFGVLLHGALRYDWRGFYLVMAGVGVVAVAGWADEVIQSMMPERVFEWRDVWLNLLGGAPPVFLLTFLDRRR